MNTCQSPKCGMEFVPPKNNPRKRACNQKCYARIPEVAAANRARTNAGYAKKGLERKYNRPQAELEAMLDAGCAMCGAKENLHIDHDHECCPRPGRSCGKCVRDALCQRHNMGLGLLDHDINTLRQAIAYLERFED